MTLITEGYVSQLMQAKERIGHDSRPTFHVFPKAKGMFSSSISGSKQTKTQMVNEYFPSTEYYKLFSIYGSRNNKFDPNRVHNSSDTELCSSFASPMEAVTIAVTATCDGYDGLLPPSLQQAESVADTWELQLDKDGNWTTVELVGAEATAATLATIDPLLLKREWGMSRPGEDYPSAKGAGNPLWECRHPQENPEGFNVVKLAIGESHIFTRRDNGSIGDIFELSYTASQVFTVEDIGDHATQTEKSWEVIPRSLGVAKLRMEKHHRGDLEDYADFTIDVVDDPSEYLIQQKQTRQRAREEQDNLATELATLREKLETLKAKTASAKEFTKKVESECQALACRLDQLDEEIFGPKQLNAIAHYDRWDEPIYDRWGQPN